MFTFKDHLIMEATMDPKQVLNRGLDKMLKMDAPMPDDKDGEKYAKGDKRVLDMFDIVEALEVVRKMFEDAEKTFKTTVETGRGDVDLSKGHRQGEKQMNILRDVKDAVQSYFMAGKSEKEGLLNRRRYRALVTLVLDPLVNTFKGKEPEEIFKTYNSVIDNAIKYVHDSDIVSHPDDAYVARQQIAREVKKAADVRKAVDGIMKLRQKAKKKSKK